MTGTQKPPVKPNAVKTEKPPVKINTFKIRVSNQDLDILNERARSVDMKLTTYLRWRGKQPIGQLEAIVF